MDGREGNRFCTRNVHQINSTSCTIVGSAVKTSKCMWTIYFWPESTFFYRPLVTWCTNSLIFNNCTLCPHCIYVFCIYLRTNSDLYHLQHKLVFIPEMKSVYCAVRTGSLNKAFCIYLRTNSDLCHLQHKLIGFYNQMKSVYCKVRTGSLNNAVCASSLKG